MIKPSFFKTFEAQAKLAQDDSEKIQPTKTSVTEFGSSQRRLLRHRFSRSARQRTSRQNRRRRRRRRRQKEQPKGVVHVKNTFNNTIVTITNLRGTVIAYSSAGQCGFSGARKSSGFASKKTAETVARASVTQGLTRVNVHIKGIGPGRKTSLRGLLRGGLSIASVRDVTGLPHNGCRPPKRRRL